MVGSAAAVADDIVTELISTGLILCIITYIYRFTPAAWKLNEQSSDDGRSRPDKVNCSRRA